MFKKATDRQVDTGLLVLRLVVGTIFAAHGAQKIFTMGFDGVAGGFGQMGIPMAEIVGPAVALLEFFGGFALIAGARPPLPWLAINMSRDGIRSIQTGFNPGGVESLCFCPSAVMLALAGAGSLSIDALIGDRKAGSGDAARAKLRRAA